MTSTPLSYLGLEYTSQDHSVGMGTSITNPANILSSMVTNQYYCQELGNESDIVFISAESYLISASKTLTVMKAMQQFVVRMTYVSGQNRLRWAHRSLCTLFTTEQMLRACGENVTVSDDWSNLTQINQQLAPLFIQIFYSS